MKFILATTIAGLLGSILLSGCASSGNRPNNNSSHYIAPTQDYSYFTLPYQSGNSSSFSNQAPYYPQTQIYSSVRVLRR